MGDEEKIRFLKNKTGFTLIEILVALAIMSVIGAVIFRVYTFSNRSYTTQNAAADAQQAVRAAMEVIVQDIRMAGLDPTASHNFGIELATATKLRFTSDSVDAGSGDFNGVIDDTNSERITYELQANRLDQILYEGTESQNSLPLIDNVQNLSFRYFDREGNDLGDPVAAENLAEISAIVISMTVRQPVGQGAPVRRTLTKRIKCRNLAIN